MSEQRTHELIDALAADLAPIRPIPPLRRSLLPVLGLFAGLAVLVVAVLGARPDLLAQLRAGGAWDAVALALAAGGAGGLLAALAAAVPGRQAAVRTGLALVAAGAGVALWVGVGWLASGAAGALFRPSGDLPCLVVAGVVALLPAFAALRVASRARVAQPLALALAAGGAATALGALAALLHCRSEELRHLLVSHAAAPLLGALLLTVPLLYALRRFERSG